VTADASNDAVTLLTAANFDELHRHLAKLEDHKDPWMFRGQADADWPLVPKAGRVSWPEDADDLRLFRGWKRRAVEYVAYRLDSDWDWLALAQHHGLATRLLDWTLNPLAAAFFAVCEVEDKDGALFAFRTAKEPLSHSQDLSTFAGVTFLLPRSVTQRISRQTSLFTVHGPPATPLTTLATDGRVIKVEIPSTAKRQVRRQLNFYGVNRLSLFPDLDGLSAHLNWMARDTKERLLEHE